MRASKLLADLDGKDDPFWKVSALREVLVALAAQERAIEALAEDAGAGPARRIVAILDGAEGGVTWPR